MRFKPTLNAFFDIYPIAAVCAFHSVNFVSVYYLYNFVHFKYSLSYCAAGVLPAAVVVYTFTNVFIVSTNLNDIKPRSFIALTTSFIV